jgi:pilus assembly protein CpaF
MKIDFGPLKTLFESESISEIMINSWNKIFVEHKGMLVETTARFVDQRQFEELIYSILNFDKKNVTSGFNFDGILPSGDRYNIALPPMSIKGPILTIRKFSVKNYSLENLVSSSFLSEKAANFLKAAVNARLSLVISGGTGSGKTSLLNTLGSMILPSERIVSIEDVAELRLNHPNWISLQSVHSDKTSVTTRQCLINALRMRPDRILVGECRKDETFEMLQAMNTGHDGSMTTVHGNSAVDCLSRLESLIQLNGVDLPLKQIRFQMSKAIDLIVQIRRRADGQREIVDITEVVGMDHDIITRATLFERNSLNELISTGLVPQILKKINRESIVLHPSFFESRVHNKRPA